VGQEKYILRVSVYGIDSDGKHGLIGRGYINMSDLTPGALTPFVVEVEAERGATIHDNTFSELAQEMDDSDDASLAVALRTPRSSSAAASGGYEAKSEDPDGTFTCVALSGVHSLIWVCAWVAVAAFESKTSAMRVADIGGVDGAFTQLDRIRSANSENWADKAGSLGKNPVVGRVNVSILFRSRSQVCSLATLIVVVD
jgi:hypothetical protein